MQTIDTIPVNCQIYGIAMSVYSTADDYVPGKLAGVRVMLQSPTDDEARYPLLDLNQDCPTAVEAAKKDVEGWYSKEFARPIEPEPAMLLVVDTGDLPEGSKVRVMIYREVLH